MLDNGPDCPKRRAPRSRFQPGIAAGMRLEERDEQLLCNLFLQRLMSRSHIERLYFSSTGRCNTRLRQLFDPGFVDRYFPPTSPHGAEAIYSLGKAALPIVASRLDMDLYDVQQYQRRNKTPTFIEHTLAIVDVWLGFRDELERHSRWELEQWVAELLCRHEYQIREVGTSPASFRLHNPGDGWRKEAFKPDGFVRMKRRDQDVFRSYFIEVDLGHTSSRQFIGKLRMHQRYLESGLFEKHFGTKRFHTLVITKGDRRLHNLVRLAEQERSDLFRFTTFDSVRNGSLLGAVWNAPYEDAPAPIL